MTGIYPEFKELLPAAENFIGASLSGNLEELDRIATSLGLVTLGSLIDTRTMTLEVLDENQLPSNCPPVQWYLPQAGLATVQGLLSHRVELSDWETAVAELLNLEAVLEKAKSRNIRFHLLVDI